MSLSGLDSPEVLTAYQTVLENGGWFLLHYTARDAIDILSQGIGGATEIRDQAVQYFEKNTGPTSTPLFGLVQVRRRKVLVKIASPDSSRLIQARAQVHWGSISSVFSEHDSEYELANAAELLENALVVNTDLHSHKTSAASPRKAPLSGIDESAEETTREARSRLTTSDDNTKSTPPTVVPTVVEPEVNEVSQPAVTPTELSHISALLLKPGEEPKEEAKPRNYLYLNDEFGNSDANRRLSSMSTKSKEFELFGSSLDFSFLDKPKVKLGPRPADNKRTASTRVSTDGRPSAALPAGLRSSRPMSVSRPISRDSTITIQPHRFPAPPPIPESPTIQIPRPKSSSGSVKSLPATLPRTNGTSKEKQRLMKFREMYKQQGKKPKIPKVPKVVASTSSDATVEGATSSKAPSALVQTDDTPKAETKNLTEEDSAHPPDESQPAVQASDSTNSDIPSMALTSDATTNNVANIAPNDATAIDTRAQSSEGDLEIDQAPQMKTTPIDDVADITSCEEAIVGQSAAAKKSESEPTIVEDTTQGKKHQSQRQDDPSLVNVNDPKATSANTTEDNQESSPEIAADESLMNTAPVAAPELVNNHTGASVQADSQATTETLGEINSDVQPEASTAVKQSSIPSSSESDLQTQKGENASQEALHEEQLTQPEPVLASGLLSDLAIPESSLPELTSDMTDPATFVEDDNDRVRSESHSSTSDHSSSHEDYEGHSEHEDTKMPVDLVVTLTDDDITPRAVTSVTTPTALSPTFGELTPERSYKNKIAEGSALPVMEPTKESRRASKRLSFAALRLSIGSGLGLSTMSLDNRASTSTSGLTIDDELGAELEEAVVEVAQTLSVSNTPVSSGYPKAVNGFRSASTPLTLGKAQETVNNDNWNPAAQNTKARSASNHVPQVPREIEITGPVAGKRVGGGIAAKIADLQRSFSRSASIKSQSSSPTSTTHSTYAQRRAVLNSSSGQPPLTPQKHTIITIPNSLASSLETTPSQDEMPRNRSPSSPRSFPPQSMINGNTISSRSVSRTNSRVATPMSESVSVSAAMDRHEQSPYPASHKRLGSVPSSPRINQGPTTAFHQRAKSAVTNSHHALHPSARSSSISSLHSSPAQSGKFDVFGIKRRSAEVGANWRSYGRVRGQTDIRGSESGYGPRNTSNSSLDDAASVESSKTDNKKQSRGARLLKRMSSSISNLTAGSRGHLQTLNERVVNNDPISRKDAVRPKGVVVGDLNVQFPDTLLWKRRWVEIDNSGFLVFKPSSATESINGIVKRFHMTEFQPPFPPDLDRQELPHSIILDLRDGRTLQCACQSPQTQRQMLHLLLEYHMAWLS